MRLGRDALALYAVTDRNWLNGSTLASQVRDALEGGVTLVQLREKDLPESEFINEAKELKELCGDFKVPLIINDSLEVLLASDADGIHVGQSDESPELLREKLGKDKIIGVSASTVEQAKLAQSQGADYLGVGAIFETGSKDDADSVSLETLKEICSAVDIPVVAIGGITKDNLMELAGSGVDGIAVISAIFAQKDIREASADLKERVTRMVKKKQH